ncbi:MAG: hypothetical protein K0R93_1001 [Anaerosolibacter sp.]|jgi:hypothetical protein|uniref:hypothetical protein n=1 Tax=Anaerosolibacter sp. TaxID=1872527 RepID=UPI002603557A|nr:hypothetical protein [Anaerosolibacter sp.]MDF2546103.1 hypothetical protein [Anaerosolibacter sp.]
MKENYLNSIFQFFYYLTADNLEVSLVDPNGDHVIENTHIYNTKMETVIHTYGKVASNWELEDIANFVRETGRTSSDKTHVLAIGEQIEDGRYIVFCCDPRMAGEVIVRELCGIIREMGGRVDSLDSYRACADEILSNLFYRYNVTEDITRPRHFGGQLILNMSLATLLMDKYRKSKTVKKITKSLLSDFLNVTPLVASTGLDEQDVLTACYILESIVGVVVSTPQNPPASSILPIEEYDFYDILCSKDDFGTVHALKSAITLGTTEYFAVSVLNGLGKTLKKNSSGKRTYQLASETFESPSLDFSVGSTVSELLLGNMYSGSADKVCPGLVELISGTDKDNASIPSPVKLPKLLDWYHGYGSYMVPTFSVMDEIMEKYLSLYDR